MFLDIINKLNADLKSQFSWLKDAERYKGEFEGNTEWKPRFPIVLSEFTTNVPVKLAGGAGRSYSNTITLWIADKDIKQPVVLDRVEAVVDFLSGYEMQVMQTIEDVETLKAVYKFTYLRTELYGYAGAGVEIYRVTFEVV
jgi:hypothetical protein